MIPHADGGSDDEENLWLACRLCNTYKCDHRLGFDPETEARVPVFDPSRQVWTDHFAWSTDGTRVIGRTPCGRATTACLQLNNEIAVVVRREWVAAGWHPPK